MPTRCGNDAANHLHPKCRRDGTEKQRDAAATRQTTPRDNRPPHSAAQKRRRSPRRPPRTRSPAALRTGRRLVTAETCDDAVHASASLRIGRCPKARTRRGKRNSRGRERLCLYLKCSRDEAEMKPMPTRRGGAAPRLFSTRPAHGWRTRWPIDRYGRGVAQRCRAEVRRTAVLGGTEIVVHATVPHDAHRLEARQPLCSRRRSG